MTALTPTGTAMFPEVARLGFDAGWLILGPHFLKFGLPTVLVDHRIAGDASLGLEIFGAHRPGTPWAPALVQVCRVRRHVSLLSTPSLVLIASRSFAQDPAALDGYSQVLAMVGDTHAIQLSWSALWAGRIGLAQLSTPYGRSGVGPRISEVAGTTPASIQGPRQQQ